MKTRTGRRSARDPRIKRQAELLFYHGFSRYEVQSRLNISNGPAWSLWHTLYIDQETREEARWQMQTHVKDPEARYRLWDLKTERILTEDEYLEILTNKNDLFDDLN